MTVSREARTLSPMDLGRTIEGTCQCGEPFHGVFTRGDYVDDRIALEVEPKHQSGTVYLHTHDVVQVTGATRTGAPK